MNRNTNNNETSATLVVGELYRSSPRLVTALGGAIAGLLVIASAASMV